MKPVKRVFVGQCVDISNNNPQVLNTRSLLSRFNDTKVEWIAPYYTEPDPSLVGCKNIRLVRLWNNRFWTWHKFLLYQMNVDAIFYPNAYWFDDLALQLRKIFGRKVPIITTLEGLGGNEEWQRTFSEWAGHQVYCQHIPDSLLRRINRVQSQSDHVIAISPFLEKIGRRMYGNKFSVLPLGFDSKNFFPGKLINRGRPVIIGAGRLYGNKRPDMFLDMAERFPQADFVWYGDGELRKGLVEVAVSRGLPNVSFPGAVGHSELGDIYREADIFVLPSYSEGWGKVTQEALACGLPSIVFGYYETPLVKDGINGYVVWNDEELFTRVGELIDDPEKAWQMGKQGAEMAKAWDWDVVAPLWESKLLELLKNK